jgi:predicted RNase H-like nuclease
MLCIRVAEKELRRRKSRDAKGRTLGFKAFAGAVLRAVLGIDAAWTMTEPSGVALAIEDGGWRLAATAPSYDAFIRTARGEPLSVGRQRGSSPDAGALLAAARIISKSAVDLVAVDMPLSREPITSRRASDRAVNVAYSSRWCSTHTPSTVRPGAISDSLREDFNAAGYPLRTTSAAAPGLMEVYPHPALVELAKSAKRLTYKYGKARDYWPDLVPGDRKARVIETWRVIAELLESKIAGVVAMLPIPSLDAKGWEMKAFEDQLDAVVCAWVAIEVLKGRAMPYGDEVSAVWIPTDIA